MAKVTNDGAKVKGFFRLQINDNGKVVGDSGWKQNTITNIGYTDYLCANLAGGAASKRVAYAMLGTGTAPGVADTTLQGEIVDTSFIRSQMSVATSIISTKTIQFAFTLAASASAITAAAGYTIQNVGLICSSGTNTSSLMCGNTFATSALASNQSVNGSYQIRYA